MKTATLLIVTWIALSLGLSPAEAQTKTQSRLWRAGNTA